MKVARCPICGREMRGELAELPYLPFCSRRCRQIDLGRWLGEEYRIPSGEPEDDQPDSDPESPP